jgi:hypothetical protein
MRQVVNGVSFELGYYLVNSGAHAARTSVSYAIDCRNTRKQYPTAFGTGSLCAAGTTFTVGAYRAYRGV